MSSYTWRGTGTNAGQASSWTNTSTGQNPATTVPGSADGVTFGTGTPLMSFPYVPSFPAGTRYTALTVDNGGALAVRDALAAGNLFLGLAGSGVLYEYGTLTVNGAIAVGRAAGSFGSIQLSGRLVQTAGANGGSINIGASSFATAAAGVTGRLTMMGGSSADLASGMSIGLFGATGAVVLMGKATLTTGGAILVGGGGTGSGGTGGGTLDVSTGDVVSITAAADTSRSNLQVGNGPGGQGAVRVGGTGAVLDTGLNGVSIGSGGGTGSVSVSGGATLKASSSDSNTRSALFAGSAAGSDGTLTVTDKGTSAVIAGTVYFGRAGKGALVVDRGASFTGGQAATGDGTGVNSFFSVSIGLGQSGTAADALFGGSGTASVLNGSTLHSLGNLSVGSNGTAGTLTVGSGSLVLADRVITVGLGSDRPGGVGSVTIQDGGTLRSGKAPNGTAGIGIGAGPGNTGTVLVTGAGSLLDANGATLAVGTGLVDGTTVSGTGSGTLTVANGARAVSGTSVYTQAAAALVVGARANETGTVSVTGAGSQIVVDGLAALGGGLTRKGGTGLLSAGSGGLFRATALTMYEGGTLSLDATGTAVIGASAGTAGALTVDAGSGVSGTGVINGAVINNGTIATGGDALGGTLTLNGAVSGSGTLRINQFGTLAMTGTGSEAISFADGTGVLRLKASGTALPGQGSISGFAGGSRLVLDDAQAPVDGAAWSQASAAGGTLSLTSGGAVVGSLNLVGDYGGYVFNVQRKGAVSTIDLSGKTGGTTTQVGDGSTLAIGAVSGNGYVVAGSATLTLAAGSSGNTVVLDGAGTVTDQGANVVFGGTGGGVVNGGDGAGVVVARGGALTVNGGAGGGVYFGQGTGSTIRAGGGAQAVLVGAGGDRLYSAGAAGDVFGVNGAGDVVMDGSASTGNDVFFGAAGTGQLTFICGSGNDVIGVGQGTNIVALGAGKSTVFANTGTTGITSIASGSGSADIGLGGAAVNFVLNAAAKERIFTLFDYVSGPDKVTLSGYGADEAARALAGQRVVNGSTVLTFSDQTSMVLVGVTKVDASIFA